MSIWFFVILILTFSLILGPIAMLRPKPAQKRKEALRHYASTLGIRFTMRKLPKLKTDMEEPGMSPVYYLAPTPQIQLLPTWILMRTHYAHEGNFFREWDWHGEPRPNKAVNKVLLEFVPRLPGSVTAITQGEAGTAVLWSEKEDKDVVDLLGKMLSELQLAATIVSV